MFPCKLQSISLITRRGEHKLETDFHNSATNASKERKRKCLGNFKRKIKTSSTDTSTSQCIFNISCHFITHVKWTFGVERKLVLSDK